MGISKTRRLPAGDLLLAFGAIAFPIHVWAIVNILIIFPAWFIRLSMWELAGAISYPLVTALLESGLLWLVLVGLSFVLPKKWLADKFAALSSLIVWLLSAWVMLAQFIFVHILQWDLEFKIGGLVLVVVSIGLAFWLVHHFGRLEGWIKKLAQNLAVLTYLYIFFDLLGLVVIILRNL